MKNLVAGARVVHPKRMSVIPLLRHASSQREGLCGPYALTTVLRHHGDRVSERTIERLARATHEHGTTPAGMARAARARGFRVRTKQWADFSDLAKEVRRGVPPIVLWFSESEGHYSIVTGMTKRSLLLVDQGARGVIRKIPRDVFRRVWFDFSTSGPEKHARLYGRWMMVVEPKK